MTGFTHTAVHKESRTSAPHLEDLVVAGLEGDVEELAHLGQLRDRFDEPLRKVARLEVREGARIELRNIPINIEPLLTGSQKIGRELNDSRTSAPVKPAKTYGRRLDQLYLSCCCCCCFSSLKKTAFSVPQSSPMKRPL